MRASPSCTRSGTYCVTASGDFSVRTLSLFVTLGLAFAITVIFSAPVSGQSAGQNVNMVSGTGWTNGDPFLERQNEPSMAVSTRNVSHLFGASNDYRSVDLPGLLGIDERGDAWLGIYKSFDGGLTWQSTLLPGFPLDGSPEGLASPIHGRQAAADPLVRSGSNGLFFLTGIAFDRGTGPLSKVFISRFIDLNNKENGDAAAENGALTNLAPRDPVKYIDTHVIDAGTPSRFLDKPWVAVDIPRNRATCTITANEDGNTVTQRVPAGAIYVTYTAFTTVGTVQNSQILFRRSTDCGVTWSKPIQLSRSDDRPTEQDAEGQGTVIAIDPSVPADQPARIYVAWRVFAEPGDPDDANRIMIARSNDGGLSFDQQEAAVTFPLSCNKKPTGVGCPFDQDETGTSFRSNGYPGLTVDTAGRIYLAWSQRDKNGDGRIMMTVMSRVQQCLNSSFREIDAGSVYDDYGKPFTNLSDRGSQLMPTLNFNAGKLMLTYYDLRQDHTSGQLTPAPEPTCNPAITPLCPIGNPFSEFRQLEGELVTNPMSVFNAYVDDATLTVRRHTLDIVGSESSPEPFPWDLEVPSFTHFRVSRYEYGVIPPGTDVDQAQFNAPNLPMFVDGTAPFMGDYIDVAGAPTMVPDNSRNSDGWVFNTSPTTNPVFHATWTDNRDVQPPPDGVSWDKYTPPISASIGPTSKFDPTKTPPACVSGYSGMRNQNIYTSAISHGLVLTSPQTAKPVLQANGQPIPRQFSLVMRNDTNDSRTFQLKIPAQPSGAQASFLQFNLQTTLTVTIPALSSASRPVFLTPKPKSTALFPSFEVDATETDGAKPPLTASILFNADPTNPVLANPDGAAFGSSSISSQEFYNPAILNPAILNPAILNPAILNPAILNPAILNPAILNPAILNPAILNPNFVVALNPAILNPAILNPAILNNAVANPAILNPAILNTPVSDANYTITNEGNTSSTYQLQLFQSGGLPASAAFQIILTKTYLTPGVSPTDGCTYGGQVNNEVIASIDNPAFVTNPTQLGNPAILNSAINNPTFSMAPGDTVQITLRANLTVDDLANLVLPNLTPVVASQAVNTVDVQQGITTPPISLLISTSTLAAAVTGQAFSTTLTALGGNPRVSADTWSLVGGSLPPGLNLSAAGVISGTPTTVGTFPFVVEVMDTGAPQHVASRQFSITVVAPVAITTPALPPAAPGAQYTQVVTASGGVPPYTWTSTGTLPPGLTLSSTTGVISGIPTTAGTYTFSVMVSDSMGVFATQTYTILISTSVTQPAQLTFVVQPTNIVGSQAISPAVQVLVTDVTGAAVPGTQVAISFANPACPSATLLGTLTGTTNANGIASFANLSVDHGRRGFTIAATAGNSSTVSNAFNVEGYCETGSMNTARHNHIVLGLPNGKVLITGGAVNPDSTGALASAELYDPVAHTFTNVGPMNVARADHTATLLQNGTVLIAGGFNDNGVVSSAEIFDPVANTFTLLAAPMTSLRAEHTATLLANGKVLIAGGNSNTTSLATAEIFDPTAGTFTATSHTMTTIRQIQHADLLPNGQVLISGGLDVNNNALASAEVYDPVAGTFTLTGGMTTARGNHASALLYNGQILVAGGLTGPGTALVSTATAELYNPATGQFTPTASMSIPRGHYAPTILNDGTIFIQGGATLPAGTNADVFNPGTGTFRTTANFTAVQAGMRESILPDGTVLLASGVNTQSVAVPNAEVFYPLAAPASITITAPALPNASQNQPYTQLFQEFGGTGNLTWTVASGALPPGLALSPAGILTGTPTASGTFTFTVTVVDSASPAKTATSGTLSLLVSAAATTLVFAPQTLPTALTSAAYNSSLVASGGTSPYSFVVTSGALPPGIALATSGAFSGTATAVGSFTFGVTVTDSSAPVQTATQSFTIQAANPLAVTTTTLPGGTAGAPYSANISSAGGVLPVGFAVTAGALPPGLSLSLATTPPQTATLSGTPTTAGSFTFTITAADSALPVDSASQSYAVTISPIATGIPGQIKFVAQPTTTTAGQPISPAITVQALDTAGIGLPGLTVTLGMGSGANQPILSGTLSAVTDSTGTATFSNVVADRAATGINLVASLSSVGTSGAVQPAAAPVSVLQGALESDTQIDLFGELAKPLPAGLAVDITAPGTYSSAAALSTGTIATGTQVNSYYIHADPVGISQNVSQLLAGEVTFPANVLGVIVTDANLNASDGVVGSASTVYPTSGRGLRLSSPTDTIILSPDQRTVTLHLSVSSATDDVRVITAANTGANLAPVTSAAFNVAAAPGSISTVAGSTWVFPGVGTATSVPIGLDADYGEATAGIATDQSGNVYFADSVNNMVFKLSGTALSVVAGTGVEGYSGDGGPAVNARLDNPTDVAFSPAGELYITDSNNSVVRKIDSAGNITTVAGNGTYAEAGDGGPATSASLSSPLGIAFDAPGNLYITDFSGAIRKVNASGIISTMSFNTVPGVFNGFGCPELLRLGPDGLIYVPDQCAGIVAKFDSAGNVTVVAGNQNAGFAYSGDGGPATSAALNWPGAIAFDTSGDIFIADEENHAIREVNAAGIISTLAGNGKPGFEGDGGLAALAQFNQPGGLAFTSSGLFIADGTNERIRRIDATGTISTVAGNGRFKYAGDGGTATAASLDAPTSVAVDPAGDVFVADIANLVVRKLNPAGVIATYVGTGVTAPYTSPYSGDGGPATAATISYPIDVQADGAGDLFLAENDSIHKVNQAGIFSTLYGGAGSAGGQHIALDGQGNVYFVSQTLEQVLKLDTTGAVTVVAGTGQEGFSGDGGPATSATFRIIRGLAVDSAGNLFIADSANSRVRKVDTSGIITTVAGNAASTVLGDGGPATSASVSPFGLVVDGAGNLYISSANRIRKVDTTGTISTIAGGGFVGSTVDGVPAVNATFNVAQGLAFDAAGNLYASDRFDDRIRKITGVTNAPPFIFNPPSGLAVATKGLPHGSLGVAYSQSVAAVGGASPYTWSVASGSLPTGLSLSAAGAVTGTPTAAGPFTFVVEVADNSGATATQSITLTIISAASTLKFTSGQMPTVISGIAYSQALPVTGGTTPYTFALAGTTTLPAGLNFNASTGVLSGTTTAAGPYVLFAQVTDSSIPPQFTSQALTLIVAAPLAISTPTLPGGTAGTPYSANVSTTGGVLPVGFAVTAGALPPGLGLSLAATPPQTATLSGTPTTAGSFTFTITAADSASPVESVSQSYTVAIAAATVNQAPVVNASAGVNSAVAILPGQATITEFPVATGSDGPEGIALGSDGNLWFTDYQGNKLWRITRSGVATSFSLPNGGSFPSRITAGPDGALWFTEIFGNRIGRITTAGGITEFPVPTGASDPSGIIAGPDGNLWFTEQAANKIGRITTAGAITEFPIATGGGPVNGISGSEPVEITVGPDGNLWFTEAIANNIAKITVNGLITEFAIPTANSMPFGIATGPDGNLWFTEEAGNKIGRMTLAGVFTEFAIPTPSSEIHPIIAGQDGNLWFIEVLGNKVGRITPSGAITEFPVPTGGSAPVGIASGGDGNFWFTESVGIKVAKINSLTNVAVTQLSGTVSDDGLPAGARLTATWSSVSGPAPVTFAVPTASFLDVANQVDAVATTATFTAPGTYVISLTGSDSLLSTSANVTITVNPLLVFAAQTLPTDFTSIVSYAPSLVASGGTPPYSFAVTSGALPAGITLGSSGTFSGASAAVGSYPFGVTVTDSSVPPQTATQTFTIQVAAALAITTSTLPAGTVGTPYAANISSTGGVQPVGFTITGGAPPPGLKLASTAPQTATLNGTPTTAGTFNFTVTASDSSNPPQAASQSYSVTIAPTAVAPANVAFAVSPQNSVEGQVLTGSPVQVLVTDSTNTPIPNAAVSMGLNGTPPCAAAALGGTLTQTTDATGTATFPDLTVNRGQFGFALAATAGTAIGASVPFNVEGFCDTGSLTAARVFHSAVALPNGTILIAGGAPSYSASATQALATAEIYNPATHTVTAVGSMHSARSMFTMTVLQNGLVLVAGGYNGTTQVSSAELFDPSSNTFTLLQGAMVAARYEHAATLLSSGKVLITGGGAPTNALSSAEVFDPVLNTFSATTGAMTVARTLHDAVLLSNGEVLVTGGVNGNFSPLNSAELYDPVANTFSATGSMATAREQHASALLYDGTVLVAGGFSGSSNSAPTATAEIYNPSSGTFSSATSAARALTGFYGSVPVLSDGTVFLDDGGTNAQIYNPAAASFRVTGNMTAFQGQGQTALLPDGTILVAGGVGSDGNTAIANAEIFYPINVVPISITTILPTALVNVPYSQQLLEKGGVGALTWTLSSGALPTGLTLSTSGLLSGTPTVVGGYVFTVQVTDSSAPPRSTTANFAVAVVPALLVVPELPTANPGVAYSSPLLIAGGAPPYTSSIISGALPAGLALANGIVSGTTTVAPGNYTFTAQVTDSSAPPVTVTQAVTMTVAAPLAFVTTTLPGGQAGVAYPTTTITTSGGSGAVQIAVETGTLPTGLTLSLQGVLSGTPTVASSFTFTVVALDSSADPQLATQTFTVVITPGSTLLTLGPATLPAATAGVAYSQNFAISGGTPPYTLSETGALPPGLTFNGTANPPNISGTPTSVGAFTNIVVTATDSLSAQAQVTYTITVNAFNAACGTGNEALLNGQYALLMQGFDANGPRTLAGSITANGAGGITAGQLDIGTDLPAGGGANQHLTIIAAQSSFSVGPDQRGCLVLATSAGSSSYRFALSTVAGGTSRGGRIIDFQLNGAYGAGFIRQQNQSFLASPTLSGSYAFLFTTPSSLAAVGHWSMMGSFNASSGTVSGGSWDYNDTQTLDGGSAWAPSGLSFPAGETYSFDASGRGTFQLPSVQQYSQSNTLASANIIVYPVGPSEFFAVVLPDANNKPLVGDIQAQVTPFTALTLNGAGFVDGASAAPIFSGGWVGLFSASQNAWSLSLDNDFAGTYSPGQASGTYAIDSTGRAPLTYTGSTSAAPIVRSVAQNKAFLMLADGTAASGLVQAFAGGVPPSTVAGSYNFGSIVGTMDRKVTNMAGVAVFDSAGNVTLTSDQATGSSQTLSAATVFTSTYSYNASTGRGVIPATGAPHYVFDATEPYILYLLDVTATDPEVQELDAFGPPAVTLAPDPLNLIIGTNGTMEVLLGAVAGGDGQVVTLTSSNPAVASVPPSVTVPAGSAGASFTVTAGATSGSADINASVAGLPPTNATVNVSQMNLGLSLPGPLLGVGRSFNATVTLASPAGANGVTVALGSSDTTIATVSPASITIPQGGITTTFAINGIATGTVILTASASGFQSAPASLTITNSLISLQSGTVTVAPGQSGSVAVSLSGLAPTGGITITFSSGNTAVATVTPSVFVPQGQQVPAANPQVTGVSIGTTVITASATGFAPDTAPVQVTVTASFSPNSLSLPATRTNNISLNISAPAPQPNGVTFNLSSDNTNFVTVPATAVIPAGQLSVTIPVTGLAPGSANLSAASSGIATVTAPVNVGAAPTMSVNVSTSLGQNLQVDGESISLSAAAPANQNLTLTSNSANVLLATTPAGPFSQSITLPMAINSFSVPSFSIQGLASSGTAQLTAQAAGYGNGSNTVTLTPSGIEWASGNFTTTTFSPNTNLTLASYQLSPTTLVAQNSQNVRTGLSVSVTVTSSDSTMGAIVTSPVTINGDTNTATVTFHPVAPGTPNLLIATPSGFTTPTGAGSTSLTATVTLPNLTINATTNLGQNLQADNQSIGLAAAPPSNESLTLTSNSPNLLIANTPAGPFSQSINLALSQGSFSVPNFSVQSLTGTGTAQLTAAAPGYNNGTITINLTPSGIEWVSGNFTTTTFSPNSTLTLASYQLNPATLTAQASQNIRTGSTVSISVTSSDTTIGTIVTSPVTINADTNTTTVLFHPVASGTANLLIATPTGFTTPNGAGSSSIAATVNAPNLSVSVSTSLGQNLQVDGESVGLGAAPPSNETLTVTSNSPNLLIANTPAGPFSQSITLALSQGSFSVPGFSMEGLASTGTAQLTASAAGYNSGTATITLTPSGIEWVSGSFNTTTFTPNTTLTLASYQLNPATLSAQASQNIRAGTTVSVTVTSSAPTVGTILNSPITISGDTNTATVGFHPLTAGTSNLVIATPTGFTTPTGTGSNTITATVSAPNLNINASTNLGQNLQVDGESVGLAAAPPNNETLTLSSSSASVLLATTPAGPFSQSITLPLSQGSFSVPGFSMQGLAASGSAQLTAQAPGYTDATVTIALTPSSIEWLNGDFSTTTFTPNTTLTVAAYQLNPATLTAQASQNLRTGLPVSVTVTSSSTAVGTIVTSPVTMNADTNTATVIFHPVAAGSTNLVITTPAGFTTPNGADSNSLAVTVTAPNLNINASTNLGQNLQVDGESIGLAAAPPNSETLTLSSNSPSLLIATTAAGPFSQSITLPLTAGSFSVPGFSMQGLASSGAVLLTASAPGYNNGTITINLTPSAIEWLSGNFTATTFSPNTTVSLASYQLNPANLTAQASQNIRTGLNVSVTVTTSDNTVGTIVASPVTLNADTNTTTIVFHPVGAGSVNLLIATPTGFTTPNGAGSSSINVTVSAPNLSVNVSSNLGQNLQVDGESISLGAAPTGSETLTLTSNSAAVLLATTPAGPFSQSITLPLTAGSFSVPGFSMQGLASAGSAQLTASAPGYNNGTFTVSLTPSAIEWSSGNFSTTTFSTDSTLSVAAYQLSPATLTAQAPQNLRTGMSVSVTITSSDTTIGTILGSPVTINADSNAASLVFHPVAAGSVNLVITTPAGFTVPNGAGSSSIAVTVSAPNLNMSVATNLGQNLQVDNQSIGLGAAPPTSRTLTLTSGSAALLLATSPAGPFSQSITLPLTAGSFTVPGFSTQALAGTGTAQITASAPGYSNGTSTITLTPSGIVWQSGSFSTTAGAANTNLTLFAAQLNATTLTAQAFQNIRTGSSVSVTVTSSVTSVGTIVTSPVTINAGADSATVVFDPLSSGVTNLVITTPTGFTTPNGNGATSIAATVN